MDIKFSLQDVSIQAPELQVDVKIGHINYEVTGLDLKDYAQLVAKLPALIADIRKAMTEEKVDFKITNEQRHQKLVDAHKSFSEIDQQHSPYPEEIDPEHPEF